MVSATTARGTVLLIFSKVLFLAGSVIIHIYLGRTLGPIGYGQYGLTMSILLWFEVIVNSAVPWAVSKVISERKSFARSTFRQGILLQIVCSLSIFVLFVALAPALARAFGDRTVKMLLWWAALDIPFFALLSVFLTYFNGLQQFGRQGMVSISRIFFKVSATVCLVAYGYSVRGALLGNILGSVFALAVGWYLISLPPPSEQRVRLIRRVLSFGVPYALFLICAQLLLNIDLWTVKALLKETAATGYYTSAQTISRVPYFLFLGLTTAIFPALSKSTSSGEEHVSRTQIKQAIRLLLLILLPVGAVVSSDPGAAVELFYGAHFAPAVPPLTALMWGMILFTVFYTLAVVLSVAGRPGTALVISLGLLLVDVILNLILVPRLELTGAALGTAVAALLGAVVLSAVIARQFRGLVGVWSLVKMILVAAILFGLSTMVPLGGVLFIAKGLILFALYVGGMVLLGELVGEDFSRIRSLWSSSS
ncbi:flippase [Candidatus Zixiibacteriota bacterium]